MNVPSWIKLTHTYRETDQEHAAREVTVGVAFVIAKWAIIIGTVSLSLACGLISGWAYALIPIAVTCGIVLLGAVLAAIITIGKT